MTDALDSMFYIVVLVLSVLGTHGTPTLSLGFPSFSAFSGFTGRRDDREMLKTYSGIRVRNDSIRMVYYNTQTVAVVELGPGKLLLNCELIEVYEPEDAIQLLHDLAGVSKSLSISFSDMLTLMGQCQLLDGPLQGTTSTPLTGNQATQAPHVLSTDMERRQGSGRGLLQNNPFTLLSGIIPGTKWCGTGDIANNYHDLGREAEMDKCCRTHDLCPLKIRAYSTRYNLTNNSLYSKSHCQCDDNLYDCLKRVGTPTANLMGNIYFNIVQVPCIEDKTNGAMGFKDARNNF